MNELPSRIRNGSNIYFSSFIFGGDTNFVHIVFPEVRIDSSDVKLIRYKMLLLL